MELEKKLQTLGDLAKSIIEARVAEGAAAPKDFERVLGAIKVMLWSLTGAADDTDAGKRPEAELSALLANAIKLVADLPSREARRALLMHWVELTLEDQVLDPVLAMECAKCLRGLEDPAAAVAVIDRALRWNMTEDYQTILHTQRAACLMDMVDLHVGDRFELEQEILRSIDHVELGWWSNDSAPSIHRRFERIKRQGGS